MKTKKGAIELSVNMLVVIIISVVILAGGIALLYQLLGQAEVLERDLDSRTKEELQRLLLQEGKQVALPWNKVMIKRGEQNSFGLGILNSGILESFTVLINPALFIPPEGEPQEDPPTASWVLYDNEPFPLKEQESKQIRILVSVPEDAASGTYLFDVKVQKSNGQRYGPIQKIQIGVK